MSRFDGVCMVMMVRMKNEQAFAYKFFAATIVHNVFDSPVLFKNIEKNFLIDIMTHNRHRHN